MAIVVGVLALAGVLMLVVTGEARITRFVVTAVAAHALAAAAERVDITGWTIGAGRTPEVEMTGVRVDDGGGNVVLEIERLRVTFDAWKLATTFGAELHVRSVEIQAPLLRLTRQDNGSFHETALLRALARVGGEDARQWLAQRDSFTVEMLSVERGRVVVSRPARPEAFVVDNVALQLAPIACGQRVRFNLRGRVIGEQHHGAIVADGSMGPLPDDLGLAHPIDIELRVRSDGLDLSSLRGLFSDDVPKPASGMLDADAHVSYRAQSRSFDVTGRAEVRNGRLAHDGVVGAPVNASANVDLVADMTAGTVEVRALDVQSDALRLHTRLKADEPSPGGIKAAHVELHVEDLGRVAAVLPPAQGLLPDGVALEGPFDAKLDIAEIDGSLQVNLDGARVAFGDVFDKPKGVPMRLEVDGRRNVDAIRLGRIAALLDQASLRGTAELPLRWDRPVVGVIDSDPVKLSRLRRVLPFLTAGAKGRLNGNVRLRARARAVDGEQVADAQLVLGGLDISSRRLLARGNAVVGVDVAVRHERHHWALAAELSELEIRLVDRERVTLLEKRPGQKAGIVANLLLNGDHATVEMARLALGDTSLQLKGRIERMGVRDPSIDFIIDPLDVAFDDVRLLGDSASSLPPDGRLRGRLSVKGPVRRPGSMIVRADDLEIVSGESTLGGGLTFDASAEPALNAYAELDGVRLDDLQPFLRSARVPADLRDLLDSLPQHARAHGLVTLRGEPTSLEALVVDADDFRVEVGRSRVAAVWELRNLVDPVSTGRITAMELWSDDVAALRASGFPADTLLTGQAQWRVDARHPELFELDLDGIHVVGAGSDALATGTISNLERPRLDVKIGGKVLDLGALVAVAGKEGHANAAALLGKLRAVAEVSVDRMVYERYSAQAIQSVVHVESGRLVFDRASCRFMGGELNLDGSQIDAAGARIRGRMDVRMKGLDAKQLSEVMLHDAAAYAGRVSFDANLTAVGRTVDELERSLDGTFSFESPELRARDFKLHYRIYAPMEILQPLDSGIDTVTPDDGRPYFRDLSGGGRIEGGKVTFTQPLRARTPFGELSLDGFTSAKELRLVGTTDMTPDTVARMTRRAYRPSTRVVAPISIGGSPQTPVLERLEVAPLMEQTDVADLFSSAGAFFRAGAEDARLRAEKLRAGAEQKALAEAARLRSEMRREREDARRRFEQHARRLGPGALFRGLVTPREEAADAGRQP